MHQNMWWWKDEHDQTHVLSLAPVVVVVTVRVKMPLLLTVILSVVQVGRYNGVNRIHVLNNVYLMYE